MSDDRPEPTPEQDREVRRLLADARHTEPMPGDVAARLDRVLAELAADGSTHAPVTVLASRRRRRVTTLLVAAAAVVAVGVGLGQVLDTGLGPTGSSNDTAARSVPESAGGGDTNGSRAPKSSYLLHDPVRIRPRHFSTDVGRAQLLAATDADVDAVTPTPGGTDGPAEARNQYDLASKDCTSAGWGPGTYVRVTYGHERGVLVFRRARGETQVADLFECGSAEPLRSITLPAP